MKKNNLIFLESCTSDKLKSYLEIKINILPKKKKNFKNANIIFTKLKYLLNKKFLEKFNNLKCIVSPTTGLTHIDLKYCKKKKIKIIHLESGNKILKTITSTTELIITFLCMSIKKVNYFNNQVKRGIWKRYSYDILQFKNYTVGIIGLGRIGIQLKKKLSYLNFKILSYDTAKDKNNSKLTKLLKNSDIITLNIPSAKNLNFFSKSKFNLCKKNVIFINTSRGEVVNENDMINFFKKNKSAQCFLDVLKNEQNFIKRKKYIKKISNISKNIFITPHIGGASKDAIAISEDYVIKKMLKYANKI